MCRFPERGYPIPRYGLGQRVETKGHDDEGHPYHYIGTIYGLSFNSPWGKPGYWYFVRFDAPRVFDDEVHEDDLS